MLSSRGTLSSMTASSDSPRRGEERVEVVDLAAVAGVAVEEEAASRHPPGSSRSRTSSLVSSSGTRSPASMIACTRLPSSVPPATFARKMSPVATCGTPNASATSTPCVPLPEPWGPTIRKRAELVADGTSR